MVIVGAISALIRGLSGDHLASTLFRTPSPGPLPRSPRRLGIALAVVASSLVASSLVASSLVASTARAETPPLVGPPAIVAAAAPAPVRSFAAEMPTKTVAGFRMEGAPRVDVVFGDIAAYKQQIDRFTFLEEQMTAERQRFATATHEVQFSLGQAAQAGSGKQARQNRRTCPTEAVAGPVATANESHDRFRQLGVALESTFGAIRDLHQLGESAGLTPDYRGRVLQSRPVYQRALVDLSEMNAVLHKQLEPELVQRGCHPKLLLDYIAEQNHIAAQTSPERPVEPDPAPPEKSTEGPVVQARAVTFFIDNRACSDSLDVFVDATLLGHVAAGTHAAFQSLSGRHSLCLLDEGSVASCGDTGTVRTAFMHDGFRIKRSCAP